MVVQTGLTFNYGEFAGIKPGVVDGFPDAEEFDSVAVAQPVAHDIVRMVHVLEPGDVGKADVILLLLGKDGDGRAPDFDD